MKKRFFLPVFFLFAVLGTILADENALYYHIKNYNVGTYLSTNSAYMSNGNLLLNNKAKDKSYSGIWKVSDFDPKTCTQETTVTVQNLATGQYIYITGNNNDTKATLSDTPCNFQIKPSNTWNTDNSFFLKVDGTSNNAWNNNNSYLSTWNNANAYSNDPGSKFIFEKVEVKERTISIQNTAYATEDYITLGSTTYKDGETYLGPTPTIADVVTYPNTDIGMEAKVEITDNTITVTYGVPTAYYYYISNKQNGGYLSTASNYMSNGNLLLSQKTKDTENTGIWKVTNFDVNTFSRETTITVQNLDNGKYIFNEGLNDNSLATLSDTPCSFRIKKAATEGYFVLKVLGTSTNGWNARVGYLSTWNNVAAYTEGTGEGSMFRFELYGVADVTEPVSRTYTLHIENIDKANQNYVTIRDKQYTNGATTDELTNLRESDVITDARDKVQIIIDNENAAIYVIYADATYNVVVKNSKVGGIQYCFGTIDGKEITRTYYDGDTFSGPGNLTTADFVYIEDENMGGCVLTMNGNTLKATYVKLRYECYHKIEVKSALTADQITNGVPEGWYLLYNVGRGGYVGDNSDAFLMTNSVVNKETSLTEYATTGGTLFNITRSKNTEDIYYNLVSNFGHNVHVEQSKSSFSGQADDWTIAPISESTTDFLLTDTKTGYPANGNAVGSTFVGWINSDGEIGPNHHYRLIPVEIRPYTIQEIQEWIDAIRCDDDTLFYFKTSYMASPKNYLEETLKAGDETAIYDAFCATQSLVENAKSTDYNFPRTGRYLIKNKGTGRYLTNYGELMNVVTPNYYSIWDLERKDDENGKITYTFCNEGTQYVMTPSVDATDGRDANGKAYTGYGYLSYTTDISRAYECKWNAENDLKTGGNYTEANTRLATIEFIPDGIGYARWHDVEDSYYACLMTSADKKWETEAGLVDTGKGKTKEGVNHDQTIQSAISGGTNELWELITLKAYDDGIDNEDAGETDYTCEANLFYKAARTDMEYYAGGPVTLNVDTEDHPLTKIKENIFDKWTEIQGIKDPSDISYAATHAGYCHDILQSMHDLKTENPGYYLSFADNEIVYFENLDRPSEGARLTKNENPNYYGFKWHTEENLSDENERAMWELRTAAGVNTYYAWNYSYKQYITATADTTSDESKAARITYSEVVPGVARLIYIENDGTSGYFSITGTDAENSANGFGLVSYSSLELSSLWKIKCYNNLTVLGGSGTTDGNEIFPTLDEETGTKIPDADNPIYETVNFSTFSYYMGTRIYPWGQKQTGTDEEGNAKEYYPYVKAYYASGTGISADGTKLQITLKAIDAANDNYTYLQKKEGFLIVGYCGENSGTDENGNRTPTPLNDNTVPVMEKKSMQDWTTTGITRFQSDMSTDEYATEAGSTYKTNLFRSTYSSPKTTDLANTYYVVSNVSKTTQIGTATGKAVYGVGIGFYPMKVGGTISIYKAYIHKSQFDDFRFVGGKWENITKTDSSNGIKAKRGQSIDEIDGVTCIQLVLQDTEGRETGIIDVDADGNTRYTPYIYDLSGRRVERPGKGIYIVNGEKKLFK